MSRTVAALPAGVRSARYAVAALFFANGALVASWVPRIPEVKAALGLSDSGLGATLAGVGTGGLLGSLLAGPLVARLGSRRASLAAAVALGAALVLPGLATSAAALALVLALVGCADATMDVAMNAHAVLVQEGYGRSIINSFHGLWSVGSVLGAVTGSAAAGLGVPLVLHLALSGSLLIGVVLLAGRRLLAHDTDRAVEGAPTVAMPTRTVAALGVLLLLAALMEDAPASWGAVYLREDLATSAGLAGAAFTAFTVAMTVSRLSADRAVERFGAPATVRAGTLLGGVGLAAGLLAANPVAAVAGFALLGVGTAPLFPLAFAAAAALPGLPPGSAISQVSLVARVGFLLSPLAIGGSAGLVGLPLALGLAALASFAAAGFARLTSGAHV